MSSSYSPSEEMEQSKNFFKVLLFDFDKKLRLPPAFCLKVSEDESKWANLKTCKGKWKVKLSRDDQGGIFFENVGWPQFVESHNLSIGDFLLFEHLDRLNFNVVVFDSSACEKEFPLENPNGESGDATLDSNKPYFTMTMQPHHALKKGHMNIPIEFIRLNNLENKRSAILKDDRGQLWPMRLVIQTVVQFRMHMGKGWRKFYESKGLKDGDVCVFYLTPSSPTSPTISFDVEIHPSFV